MFQYRQVLVRLRQGNSDRDDIARAADETIQSGCVSGASHSASLGGTAAKAQLAIQREDRFVLNE